jgi:hypothetical protein
MRHLAVAKCRYGSKADMAATPRDVRFTPKADIGCVFLRPRPNKRRNFQTHDRFRSQLAVAIAAKMQHFASTDPQFRAAV